MAKKNLVDKECKSVEYGTPERILGPVRKLISLQDNIREDNARIGVDPCTTMNNPTRAYYSCTKEEDGLTQAWDIEGRPTHVFVNPPYGKSMYDWIAKTVREAFNGHYIVLLLAASSRWDQPKWNALFSRECTAMVPIHSPRVRFIDLATGEEKKNNTYPSILFVYNYGWEFVKLALGPLGTPIPIGRSW